MVLSCSNDGEITISPSDITADELKKRHIDDICNDSFFSDCGDCDDKYEEFDD